MNTNPKTPSATRFSADYNLRRHPFALASGEKKQRNYIIMGAGGHGAVVADILRASGKVVLGFLDDGIPVGTKVLGAKVFGKLERCADFPEAVFIIGVGDNAIRKKIAQTYTVEYGQAIHPSAIIGEAAEIGLGTVVMANSIINPRTKIGGHCIINTSASIDHDNNLGNFVHVSPGAVSGGDVSIAEGTHVGIGAVLKNGISICSGTVIGAGAVVVKNITEPGTYIGLPAARI
ncbi:MAG: acetyltransferase [Oscillospiraceae bacterium]|nr:acetyltransferase [Oscillospiraceae bacterium]